MKGTTVHSAYLTMGGSVELSNNEDGYYWQRFETEEELDIFIKHLIDMKEKAFPKETEHGSTIGTTT